MKFLTLEPKSYQNLVLFRIALAFIGAGVFSVFFFLTSKDGPISLIIPFFLLVAAIVIIIQLSFLIKKESRLSKFKRTYTHDGKSPISELLKYFPLSEEKQSKKENNLFDADFELPKEKYSELLEKYGLNSDRTILDFLQDSSIPTKEKNIVALFYYLGNLY